jgi:hypothetical protein
MFQDELREYVRHNSRSVKMRESAAYPGLYVLKYSKQVFYKNSWDNFLEECRGAVVDENFNLIAYPFTKIYNFGIESRAPKIGFDTKVTAFRKVNGFMASVTWYNGDLLISTTGSLDSEYVEMVKQLIRQKYNYQDWCLVFSRSDLRGMTFMFECCHVDDPHIVPEKEGMYLLGYRENVWGSRVQHDSFILRELAQELGCYTPECTVTNMGRVQEMVKECRHEGYVIYTDDGVSTKIKSPYYLVNKWVARNPRTDKLVDLKNDVKRSIDEEYHNLIDYIRENIVEYTSMSEQQRLEWVRNYMENAV